MFHIELIKMFGCLKNSYELHDEINDTDNFCFLFFHYNNIF